MIMPTTVKNEDMIVIGMGEIAVKKQSMSVLSCLGLGSCIALCAYDPVSKVGGMVHIVLPQGGNKEGENCLAKYADTAVPLLLQEMAKNGGIRSRLVVKLVGGAQLSLALGLDGAFKTGERNTAMVIAALTKEGIPVAAMDVGGNRGRTVRMFLDTGKVTVRTAGNETKEL